MSPMSILDELQSRGLIQDLTNKDALRKLLDSDSIPFYAGYDPTAVSLHAGNLIPICVMARLQQAGHKPIVLVGGATGMIGDPSGKSAERPLLDTETLASNVGKIKAQLEKFLRFGDGKSDAVMTNNADWFAPIGYLDFLRDVGKLITVNYMAAKESVRSRLSDREQGISYTELSYMLLQGYDFVHLAKTYDCRLQIGGSDQWGNITTGIEMQRKMGRPPLYGLVSPLLVDASGNKMGKTSAGDRVWLDPTLTSPYAFYQYWLNVEDSDVERLLNIFSHRPLDEISDLAKQHASDPQKRIGQRALAKDLTLWVHGAKATTGAIAASQVMFGGSIADLSDDDLRPLLDELPSTSMPRDELAGGISLIDILHQTGLARSKGDARRLASGGGVYINNVRVDDPLKTLTTENLATKHMMILRAGKKKYHIICVT